MEDDVIVDEDSNISLPEDKMVSNRGKVYHSSIFYYCSASQPK